MGRAFCSISELLVSWLMPAPPRGPRCGRLALGSDQLEGSIAHPGELDQRSHGFLQLLELFKGPAGQLRRRIQVARDMFHTHAVQSLFAGANDHHGAGALQGGSRVLDQQQAVDDRGGGFVDGFVHWCSPGYASSKVVPGRRQGCGRTALPLARCFHGRAPRALHGCLIGSQVAGYSGPREGNSAAGRRPASTGVA